jgi:hypothetical protein
MTHGTEHATARGRGRWALVLATLIVIVALVVGFAFYAERNHAVSVTVIGACGRRRARRSRGEDAFDLEAGTAARFNPRHHGRVRFRFTGLRTGTKFDVTYSLARRRLGDAHSLAIATRDNACFALIDMSSSTPRVHGRIRPLTVMPDAEFTRQRTPAASHDREQPTSLLLDVACSELSLRDDALVQLALNRAH